LVDRIGFFLSIRSTLNKDRFEITFSFCYEASIRVVSFWLNTLNYPMNKTYDLSL